MENHDEEIRIPAVLISKRKALLRRNTRAMTRLDKLKLQQHKTVIQPSEEAFNIAKDALEDFEDQEFINTGRHPSKIDVSERSPLDVQQHRALGRDFREALKRLEQSRLEVHAAIMQSDEYTQSLRCAEALDDWSEQFELHYETCERDIDWEKGLFTRRASDIEGIPQELLA